MEPAVILESDDAASTVAAKRLPTCGGLATARLDWKHERNCAQPECQAHG